ncbi:phosphoserine phosphatase, chloroplastic [Tanacetum coccineum]
MVCKDEGIDELAEFCGGGKAVVEWTARVMEALATGLDLFKPSLARIQDFLEKMPSSNDQSSVLGSPSMVVAVNGTSECDVTDYWCPILHMVAAVGVTSECDIGVHVGGSLDTTTQPEAIAYTTYSHSGHAILLMTGAPERTTESGRHLDESHRLQRVSSNGLIEFLDNHNALVRLFRTARDKLKDVDVPKFKSQSPLALQLKQTDDDSNPDSCLGFPIDSLDLGF